MIGAGLAPAGWFSAGFGQKAGTRPISGLALSDVTGIRQAARYIDPVTKSYVVDSNGRYVGLNETQHIVLNLFLTQRNSSSVFNFGLKPTSGVVGKNFVARRTEDIRQSFEFLRKLGLAEIVDVEVDAAARPIVTIVRWRDLQTGDEFRNTI